MTKTARIHLIEERKRRRWSQQKIADLVGTTQNNVSRWELGLTTPSFYFCTQLCTLFDKTPQELGLVDDAPDEALELLKLNGEEIDPALAENVPMALPSSTLSVLDSPLARPEKGQDVILSTARAFRWTNQRVWISILTGVVLLALVLGGILVTTDAGHNATTRVNTPTGINFRSTIDPYGADSTLAISDDLTGTTNPAHWDADSNGDHGCFFRNHTYDVLLRGLGYCVANSMDIANFVYQIQLKIVQGHAAGIIFRTNDGAAQTYYIFEITVDGNYFVQRNDSSEDDAPLTSGSSTAIKTGFDQPNTLAVDANGGQMTIYINGRAITPLTDSHYSSGLIGVIVGEQLKSSDAQTVTEADYNYARVWI